jgi:hypothetical protein
MISYWVDANVLLRLITNDPPDLAERATHLVKRAGLMLFLKAPKPYPFTN